MGDPIGDRISLSALVNGFSSYAKTAIDILRHPFKFPETLQIEEENAFRKALSFVLYSIALLFFLLVPIFSKHAAEVSKVTFLIRYLVQFAMYAVLLHVGLRIIGRSKRDLRGTVVAYSYMSGVCVPLVVILLYPIIWSFGPVALFGTPKDIIRLTSLYQEHQGLLIYAQVTNVVFGIFSIIVGLSWFSRTHQVSKVRVFFSLILGGLIGGPIQIFVLNPVFLAAFESVDRWMKYTG